MAKKRYYDKMKSAQDGGMIAGPVGSALMPQNVIIKKYPRGNTYLPENINDGMSGIDNQIKTDINDTKSDLAPDKY